MEKFNEVWEIVCDMMMPLNLRAKVYKTEVRRMLGEMEERKQFERTEKKMP